jgi:hypothetical protein
MLNSTYRSLLLCLCVSTSTQALAQVCSSPKGNYGFGLQGRQVDGQAYAAVGLAHLGKETFTLDLTASVGGTFSRKTIQGSLQRVDCGLTLAGLGADAGFVLKGQIADHGDEIFVTEIQASSPLVASGVMRPVGLQRCNNKTIKGEYNYLSQGYESNPNADGAGLIPKGVTGVEVFDGKGCSTYDETIKQGSVISAASGPLGYQVFENCTFGLLENGQTAFYGVIVRGGQGMSYMKIAPGSARTGEYNRSGSSAKTQGCP